MIAEVERRRAQYIQIAELTTDETAVAVLRDDSTVSFKAKQSKNVSAKPR